MVWFLLTWELGHPRLHLMPSPLPACACTPPTYLHTTPATTHLFLCSCLACPSHTHTHMPPACLLPVLTFAWHCLLGRGELGALPPPYTHYPLYPLMPLRAWDRILPNGEVACLARACITHWEDCSPSPFPSPATLPLPTYHLPTCGSSSSMQLASCLPPRSLPACLPSLPALPGIVPTTTLPHHLCLPLPCMCSNVVVCGWYVIWLGRQA